MILTDRVPDTRPYLARAGAFVVPLRMGSGTRLKVLEAMAMGRNENASARGITSRSLAGCADVQPGSLTRIAELHAAIAASPARASGRFAAFRLSRSSVDICPSAIKPMTRDIDNRLRALGGPSRCVASKTAADIRHFPAAFASHWHRDCETEADRPRSL